MKHIQQHKKRIKILSVPILAIIILVGYLLVSLWYPYQNQSAVNYFCKPGTKSHTTCSTTCLSTQSAFMGLTVKYSYQYRNCNVSQFGPGCDGQLLPSVRSGYMLTIGSLHFNFDTKIENPVKPGKIGC